MIKTNIGHQKFMNDAFYYPNKIINFGKLYYIKVL